MKNLLIAVLLLAGMASGHAASLLKVQTAGFLADACKRAASSMADGAVADGFCVGTFGAWRTVIDELPVLTPNRSNQISIDSTAENGQLERVFIAYVSSHPEVENRESFLVFCWALKSVGLMKETKVNLAQH